MRIKPCQMASFHKTISTTYYFFRMGSFTSKSIIPPTCPPDDIHFEGVNDAQSLLRICSEHLSGLPEPIKRKWKRRDCMVRKSRPMFERSLSATSNATTTTAPEENIRILQWNALSQSKSGSKMIPFYRPIKAYT